MIGLDALGREVQRRERVAARAGVRRRRDLGRRDPQRRRRQLEPVEAPRVVDQRRVAARLHVVEDGRDGRVDIGGELALAPRRSAAKPAAKSGDRACRA